MNKIILTTFLLFFCFLSLIGATEIGNDINEREIIIDETSTVNVKRNETISILLRGQYWDMFWKTRAGLEFSNDIELLENGKYDGSYVIYKIRIKETARAKELEPVLQFDRVRNVVPANYQVTLYVDEENSTDGTINNEYSNEKLVFFENDVFSVDVKRNETVNLFFNSRSWILTTEREFANSNDIEFLGIENVDEYYCYYKFKIKETAKNNLLYPKIKFKPPMAGLTNEYSRVISLVIKEEEKTLDDYLPVYYYKPNSEQIAYIESYSILYVDIKKSVGRDEIDWRQPRYSRANSSNFNIEDSDIVDLIDVKSENCPTSEPCIVKETYKYLIKNVKNVDDLPPIELYTVTNDVVDSNTESTYEQLSITLKLKSSSDCSLNGYQCCSKSNPKIYYQDEDGDWSIENGDWCIIKDPKVKNTTKPQLIRICDAYSIGFQCCEKEHLLYDNYISLENLLNHSTTLVYGNEPCVLHTCIYTGNYPICENPNTKVVYTDTENWGIENNDWCVICY